MDLQSCQELACAADLQAFETRLVRFANNLGFGLITGVLVLDRVDGSVTSLPFGNFPDGYKSIFENHEIGKRDPVMRRLKRFLVPITYDQSMYVNEGAADVWEVQAQYGFKTGISLRLESDGGKHFVIGVDREQPLPNDCVQLTRMTADLCLFAAYAQVAALRLLGGADYSRDELPPLTLRECEILKWTADGKSAWAVGQILSTNEHTVNYHLRRIREKLSVASKHQAVARAKALRLI